MNTPLQSTPFPNAFYEKTGSGFPIILLHGFLEDRHIWKHQYEALQSQYTVIVPDVPGSGLSDLPAETMSMELIADFVAEILLQEKIDKTILFGHSMGGYAGMAFLKKYEHQLLGFGLVHSTAFADNEEKKQLRQQGISIIKGGGKDSFIKTMIPNSYSVSSQSKYKDDIQEHIESALKLSDESLIAYSQAMHDRFDHTETLKECEIPVFIFSGREDLSVPFEQSLAQSHFAKWTTFHAQNGIAHMGMTEAAETLNLQMLNFCQDVLQRKTS